MGRTMKLNLGCGKIRKEGYVNIDKIDDPAVDLVCDITKGLPFKDNSIHEVYTRHTLQQIFEYDKIMEEIHRVCKQNSLVTIIVPYYSSYAAHAPDHVRFFNFGSFDIFDKGKQTRWKKFQKVHFRVNRVEFRFQRFSAYNPLNLVNFFFSMLANKKPYFYERLLSSLYPAYEIEFVLEVMK